MTATQDILMTRRMKENSIAFKLFIFILNLSFFVAVPVAMAVTGTDGAMLFKGLIELFCGPSKLVTDYFALGCLSSTLLNVGI